MTSDKKKKGSRRRKGVLDNKGRELRIENYLARLEFLRYQRNQEVALLFEQTIELLSLIEAEEIALAKKISDFNQSDGHKTGSTHVWAGVKSERYRKKGIPIIFRHEFYHYRPGTKNTERRMGYLGNKTAWRRVFRSCYSDDELADSAAYPFTCTGLPSTCASADAWSRC